jgi:hypothetical protein
VLVLRNDEETKSFTADSSVPKAWGPNCGFSSPEWRSDGRGEWANDSSRL